MTDFLNCTEQFLMALQDSEFCRANDWQERTGQYRGDCSGLILHLLHRFRPATFHAEYWQAHLGVSRPKAWQLFEYAHTHGQSSLDYRDVKAGDLLFWRKRHPPKSGDTGHALVVLSVHGFNAQQQLLTIDVLDASKRPHDDDSRKAAGVGVGTMYLSISDAGRVNGYIWSELESKRARIDIVKLSQAELEKMAPI